MALSGGERRRCEIARALAAKPSIMLLDEPFAGIDPLAIADIRDVIGYLKGRGIGILITDHNVRETLDIIDRAGVVQRELDGFPAFELGAASNVLALGQVARGDFEGARQALALAAALLGLMEAPLPMEASSLSKVLFAGTDSAAAARAAGTKPQ